MNIWNQETILSKLKEIHPQLDFTDFIFKSVNHKSIVICKYHGPFEIKVMNLLRNNGCNTNNIKLIRIKYNENILNKLEKEINYEQK